MEPDTKTRVWTANQMAQMGERKNHGNFLTRWRRYIQTSGKLFILR